MKIIEWKFLWSAIYCDECDKHYFNYRIPISFVAQCTENSRAFVTIKPLFFFAVREKKIIARTNSHFHKVAEG